MRLLHSTTYELKEFISDTPPYAILSHTWGNEEVTFQDIQRSLGEIKQKEGFKKLGGCCAQAQKDGYFWVWIDTCCIDKTSSSELSEAINSMYQWYQKSDVCYAYMADVPRLENPSLLWDHNGMSESSGTYTSREHNLFAQSRWFRRGWTLQELIAPKRVEFYACDWSEIGTKRSLTTIIQTITSIPPNVLRGGISPNYNHAIRMSWAANRITTREEDMAYCLLGLFEVNMPLLYGEGRRAFYRLQEEIFRKSESLDLLVWSMAPPTEPQVAPPLTSVLASSPRAYREVRAIPYEEAPKKQKLEYFLETAPFEGSLSFVYSSGTIIGPSFQTWKYDPPTITSRGMSTTLKVLYLSSRREYSPWLLAYIGSIFNPLKTPPESHVLICVILQRQSWGGVCKRARPDICITVSQKLYSKFKAKRLYLSTEADLTLTMAPPMPLTENLTAAWRLKGVYLVPSEGSLEIADAFPKWQTYQEANTIFLSAPTDPPPCYVEDQERSGVLCLIRSPQNPTVNHPFLLLFGLTKATTQAWCDIYQYSDHGVVAIKDKIESYPQGNKFRWDRIVRTFPELGLSVRLATKMVNTKIFPRKKGDLVITMEILPMKEVQDGQIEI